MPTLKQNNDVIYAQPTAQADLLLPSSINANLLKFAVMCGSDGSTWVDTTGNHTVTPIGTPTLNSNKLGMVGTTANCLELNLKEEDLPVDQSFTAMAIAKLNTNATGTCSIMGAVGGTNGSTDTALGYNGWNMQLARDATQTRNIVNASMRRDLTVDEYRQSLFYSQSKAVNDSDRMRLIILRMDVANRTLRTYDFAGYDGVAAVPFESFTFGTTDVLTGRLRGKTNIRLGSNNGTAGSAQCQFVAGAMFTDALTDAQIKDLGNSVRRQYLKNDLFNGVATASGLSVASGFTPFDLFAPALT
jgi:hypothetical protein